MKRSIAATLVVMTLSCAFTQAAAGPPDGRTGTSADTPPEVTAFPGITTIAQVLSREVPADYTVYADDELRLDVAIRLDRSRHWLEALKKALAEAGVIMAADVDRKLIALKPDPAFRTNGSKPFAPMPEQKVAKLETRRGTGDLREVRREASFEVRTVAPGEPVEEGPAPVARPARYHMDKGQPIHLALEAWASEAGWTLVWYPSVSWRAISAVDMKDKNDVVEAVSEVIGILRDEGKAVRLRVSDGNNVMEVVSTEVRND